MRQCQTCSSVVQDKDVCPVCGASVIYAPVVMEDREHFSHNRYYYRYLLRSHGVIAACILICLGVLIPTLLTRSGGNYEDIMLFSGGVMFLLVGCLIGSLTARARRWLLRAESGSEILPQSEEYLALQTGLLRYVFPILLTAVFIVGVNFI